MNTGRLTDRMFYEDKGQMAVSAIFGLALAFLFQRICKDRKCIVVRAPNPEDIVSNVYQFEDDCFVYKPVSAKCPDKEEDIVRSV